MQAEPTDIKAPCQSRHADVSHERQSGIGWLAPLIAVAGLCMALAGASGWGEEPAGEQKRSAEEPPAETFSNGAAEDDAAPPDAGFNPGQLVGLLQS